MVSETITGGRQYIGLEGLVFRQQAVQGMNLRLMRLGYFMIESRLKVFHWTPATWRTSRILRWRDYFQAAGSGAEPGMMVMTYEGMGGGVLNR